MKVSLIEEEQARALLRDAGFVSEWDALYALCPFASEFQSSAFLTTWFRVFAERYSPILIAGRDAAGSLTGLLWLAKSLRTDAIHVAGHAQAEYHGWLARGDLGSEFIDEALGLYFEAPRAVPLTLRLLLPDIPLGWAGRDGRFSGRVLREPVVRPLLELEKLDIARKAVAKKNKGRFKRLQSLGTLEFQSLDEPGRLESYWPEIARQLDQRIAVKVSFVKDPIYGAFFFALMRRDPRLVHAFVLLLDGKLIAATIAHRCRQSAALAINSFDERYASYSPSKLLILKAAESVQKLGYSALDLTPYGDWKLMFATRTEIVQTLTIHPRLSTAFVDAATRKARRIVARSLDRLGIDRERLKRLIRHRRILPASR